MKILRNFKNEKRMTYVLQQGYQCLSNHESWEVHGAFLAVQISPPEINQWNYNNNCNHFLTEYILIQVNDWVFNVCLIVVRVNLRGYIG